MKHKKIISCILAIVMVISMIPVTAAFAGDTKNRCNIEILSPVSVYQGDNTYLNFQFEFSKEVGEYFQKGEKIELSTNIGDLFDAEWEKDFKGLEIKDNEKTIAKVDINPNKIVITIQTEKTNTIRGRLSTLSKLVAKNVGATDEKPVKKELYIDCATKEVTFNERKNVPGTVTEGSVDIDLFWKNAGVDKTQQMATMYMEVNPIGSMHLYGSTTRKEGGSSVETSSYRTMVIEDKILEQGIIDPESVQIYAAVPKIGVRDHDFTANTWFKVPAGTYYAVRNGTMRYLLNDYKNNPNVKLFQIKQTQEETLEQFKNRINAKQLQWGIYYDENEKSQTFLCNFGNVGKFEDGTKNNGLLYKDYHKDYYDHYPEIFGEAGESAGNIVSYYIEFNTYYPDVTGEKKIVNTAYISSPSIQRKEARQAEYTINNGNGIGVVRNKELKLKLVDKEDLSTPIVNAEFKVEQWKEGQWKSTGLKGKTDLNGIVNFGPFPQGKYRVVQLSTIEGYKFDNNTYGLPESSRANQISQDGIFEVKMDDQYGYGSIVTNEKKKDYQVEFKFVTNQGETKELPQEVIDQCPPGQKIQEGKTAEIPEKYLTFAPVKTDDGVWSFVAWDKTKVSNVADNVVFTGIWKFAPFLEKLNEVPVIHAEDKVIYIGDEFDERKDVTAKDAEDGDLTEKLEVLENTVDTTKLGVYEVTYKVTDSEGASIIKKIYVTVNPRQEKLNEVPVIHAEDKVIHVGDEFDERKDVTAKDAEDGDLTEKLEVLENTVDTTKAGVYEVTYKVTDSEGASIIKKIYVTVNPRQEKLNEVPVIHAEDKVIHVGDEFDERKDVTAKDAEDGDLTEKLEVLENTVDTTKAGVYEVTYKVTDSEGASIIKKVQVTVLENEKIPDSNRPEKPEDHTDSQIPKTGDDNPAMLWISIGVLAFIVLIVVSVYKRKRK